MDGYGYYNKPFLTRINLKNFEGALRSEAEIMFTMWIRQKQFMYF